MSVLLNDLHQQIVPFDFTVRCVNLLVDLLYWLVVRFKHYTGTIYFVL